MISFINREVTTERDSIYYGDMDESIYTENGKKKLWDEEKIIFLDGVHAFKIEPREEGCNPLIHLFTEDDECLFDEGVCFDSSWLEDLKKLIDETLIRIKIKD